MISEGTSASVATTVTDHDTAIALGSGDVAVLGTPRLAALCEEAAVAVLAGALADGLTSVGTNVNVDHLAATSVGGTVAATATITAVDGKRIAFALLVKEGGTVVARGTHTRLVVDRKRFTSSL